MIIPRSTYFPDAFFEISYSSSFVVGSRMFLAEGNHLHSALRKEETIVVVKIPPPLFLTNKCAFY